MGATLDRARQLLAPRLAIRQWRIGPVVAILQDPYPGVRERTVLLLWRPRRRRVR